MDRRTRLRVASATVGTSRITRDTVARETPASAAMSNKVGRNLRAWPMALEGSKFRRKLKVEIDGEYTEIDLSSNWIDPKTRASLFFLTFLRSLERGLKPLGI